MNKKLSKLSEILTHLGLPKEAFEVGLFAFSNEIYIVEKNVSVPNIYNRDLNYKKEIEKANPGLDWDKLQIGQKILLPSQEEFLKRVYPNKSMSPSQNAFNIIKNHEKYRAKPYNDGYGNMTIGYGHVIKPGEKLQYLSEYAAEKIMIKDSEEAANAIRELVRVKLSQNQFDALVSFVFNLGRGTFAGSDLLSYLNKKQLDLAANEFLKFIKAGKKDNSHLLKRRKVEKDLFVS